MLLRFFDWLYRATCRHQAATPVVRGHRICLKCVRCESLSPGVSFRN